MKLEIRHARNLDIKEINKKSYGLKNLKKLDLLSVLLGVKERRLLVSLAQ